jgi:hypothetical protein
MLIITLTCNDAISIQIGRYVKLLATRNIKIVEKIFDTDTDTIHVSLDATSPPQRQWATALAQDLFSSSIINISAA